MAGRQKFVHAGWIVGAEMVSRGTIRRLLVSLRRMDLLKAGIFGYTLHETNYREDGKMELTEWRKDILKGELKVYVHILVGKYEQEWRDARDAIEEHITKIWKKIYGHGLLDSLMGTGVPMTDQRRMRIVIQDVDTSFLGIELYEGEMEENHVFYEFWGEDSPVIPAGSDQMFVIPKVFWDKMVSSKKIAEDKFREKFLIYQGVLNDAKTLESFARLCPHALEFREKLRPADENLYTIDADAFVWDTMKKDWEEYRKIME